MAAGASVPARAFIRPYAKQTLGSGQYYGTTASVDFGHDLHFKPQFSTYHSGTSSGTFDTYSIRGEYDFDRYGVALMTGISPTVNAYNNHFVGGELSIGFDFDEPPAADTTAAVSVGTMTAVSVGTTTAVSVGTTTAVSVGTTTAVGVGTTTVVSVDTTSLVAPPAPKPGRPFIRRLDLTGGVTQTYHRQVVTTNAEKSGNSVIPATSNTKSIAETDVEGSAVLTLVDWAASLDVTKATYNVDLARLSTKSASVVRLAGLVSTIQGFPDLNVVARVDCERWLVAPYVSYTYTHYKVTQPISVAYTFGAKADWDLFYLDGSYQRFAQKGAADINYYSLAAKFRF